MGVWIVERLETIAQGYVVCVCANEAMALETMRSVLREEGEDFLTRPEENATVFVHAKTKTLLGRIASYTVHGAR